MKNDNSKLHLLISIFILFFMYPIQVFNGNKYLVLFLFNFLILFYNNLNNKNIILKIFNIIFTIIYSGACFYISKTSTNDDSIKLIYVKVPTIINILISSVFEIQYIAKNGFVFKLEKIYIIKIICILLLITVFYFVTISDGQFYILKRNQDYNLLLFKHKRIDFQKYFFLILLNILFSIYLYLINIDLTKYNKKYNLKNILNLYIIALFILNICLIILTYKNIFKFKTLNYIIYFNLFISILLQVYTFFYKKNYDIVKHMYLFVPISFYIYFSIFLYPGDYYHDTENILKESFGVYNTQINNWHSTIIVYLFQIFAFFPKSGGIYILSYIIFTISVTKIFFILVKNNLLRNLLCLFILAFPPIMNQMSISSKGCICLALISFVICMLFLYFFKEHKILYLISCFPSIIIFTTIRITNYLCMLIFIIYISYLIFKYHKNYIRKILLSFYFFMFFTALLSPGSIGIKKGIFLILFILPSLFFYFKDKILKNSKILSIIVLSIYYSFSSMYFYYQINHNKNIKVSNSINSEIERDLLGMSYLANKNLFPKDFMKEEFKDGKELMKYVRTNKKTNTLDNFFYYDKNFSKMFKYDISKSAALRVYIKNFKYWLVFRLGVTTDYLFNGINYLNNSSGNFNESFLNFTINSYDDSFNKEIVSNTFLYKFVIYLCLNIAFLLNLFFAKSSLFRDKRLLFLLRLFNLSALFLYAPLFFVTPSTDIRYLITFYFTQLLSIIIFVKQFYLNFKDKYYFKST